MEILLQAEFLEIKRALLVLKMSRLHNNSSYRSLKAILNIFLHTFLKIKKPMYNSFYSVQTFPETMFPSTNLCITNLCITNLWVKT